MDLNTQKNQSVEIEKNNILYKLLRMFSVKGRPGEITAIDEEDTQQLLENIRIARKEWIRANRNFEYVDDQEIIDYYTYNIKACQVRYEYLLKKAKEKNIKVELIEAEGNIFTTDDASRR